MVQNKEKFVKNLKREKQKKKAKEAFQNSQSDLQVDRANPKWIQINEEDKHPLILQRKLIILQIWQTSQEKGKEKMNPLKIRSRKVSQDQKDLWPESNKRK